MPRVSHDLSKDASRTKKHHPLPLYQLDSDLDVTMMSTFKKVLGMIVFELF